MEDIVQYLEQSVENVRGVDMVPLASALQAIQVASSLNLLESLDQTTAELYKSLKEQEALGELDIEE
jgi:hypothetical protein